MNIFKELLFIMIMKFPSIEVNTTNTKYISFIFNKIFDEENAIDYIEELDNGSLCIHFNQNLPMTPKIQDFYHSAINGEIKLV